MPIEVVVFEARARLGGRVEGSLATQNLLPSRPKSERKNIQLDANWVHGLSAENPLFKIIVSKYKLVELQSSPQHA